MDCVSPPKTRREPTYTDVGNADIAGANICHPWGLGIRIPADDGLSKVLPIHVSRVPLIKSMMFLAYRLTRDQGIPCLIFVGQQCGAG